MEVISYSNIKVEGFPFQKIISVDIRHGLNDHGAAEIVGEVKSDEAQGLVQRADEKLEVTITTGAEGQPPKLFCGCVKSVSMQEENEYSQITLRLYTTSRKLDISKEDKTYQNTAKTYGQIISEDIADTGDLHMMVSDKAIGSMLMKYNETDWQFSMRMAGKLGAPLIGDISAARPQIYIGMPPARKTITLEKMSSSCQGDLETDQYAYIGDIVSVSGKSSIIKSVHAFLTDGIMHITYELIPEAAASAGSMGSFGSTGSSGNAGSTGSFGSGSTGGTSGIAAPAASSQASGKMMKGTVKAVQGDKVQVHLTDVDKSYDGGGSWWFPFSTAYSSSDGSGWYCMPEVGDEVRVFFPSGNEGEAFAASSVCANPPTDPKHKSWKAPGGKEILLTDDGLYIIGKSGKIYINLTDEKGVEIYSDKEINISSDAKINITAADEVHIVAENEIIVGTEEAYIDLTKNTATLAASEVLIN